MMDTDGALSMIVLLAVGFLGSCGSCVATEIEKNEVCAIAASKSATLRDSVALNNAGCDLKLSTAQPETPR